MGLQKEGTLDELRFGEFKMVIERGQWVVVAAVLTAFTLVLIKRR